MQNLRITSRQLEDGSTVHQVRFEALHADNTQHRVTLEVNSQLDALELAATLGEAAAYAETDPS